MSRLKIETNGSPNLYRNYIFYPSTKWLNLVICKNVQDIAITRYYSKWMFVVDR